MVQNLIFYTMIFIMPFICSGQITIERDNNGNITKESYPNNYSISYKYDSSGNRITTIVSESVCPGDSSLFYAGTTDMTSIYQWQVDTGTGFMDVINDGRYSGAQSPYLKLINAPTSWYGYKYRCYITKGNNTSYSETKTLKFQLVWNGSVSTAWENPLNWGCSKVPDSFIDVYIYGNTRFSPVVSLPSSCRSLTVVQGAVCTVLNDRLLDIAGK